MRNWLLKNGEFVIGDQKLRGYLCIIDGIIIKFIVLDDASQSAQLDDRINKARAVFANQKFIEIDCQGAVVGPGFIDLHVHGGGGADVMDASQEAFEQMANMHGQKGTTRFLLTTVTADHHSLLNVCTAVKAWSDRLNLVGGKLHTGAQPLGIHLEGPYIAYSKKGAQNGEYVRPFSAEEFAAYQAASDQAIKLITLAPEQLEDMSIITALAAQGIVVSIGHTEADYDTVDQAVQHGAKHFTHLCNAMPGLHHRQPGPIAYALNSEKVSVELIADGLHVHPAIIQLALRAKDYQQVAIVTDAIRATGMSDGTYDLGGLNVQVQQGKATLEDGTLAGSCLDMESAYSLLKTQVGLTDVQLFQLMSTTPARILGLTDQFGTLAEGSVADLVVLKDGQVSRVMVNGSWIKGA